MKKIKFIPFIIAVCNMLLFSVYANELQNTNAPPHYNIVFDEYGNVHFKTGLHDIALNNAVYYNEKECCFMIPIKEFLYLSSNEVYFYNDFSKQTVTMQFYDDEIVFFRNKRNVLLNGKELGLFTIPNIIENEIYISLQDMCVLFDISYNEDTYDQLKIDEYGADITFHNKNIKVNDFKQQQKQYRINAQDGEILKQGIYYNILTYKKQNHIMIAVSELQQLTGNNVNVSVAWENNTAYIKTWKNSVKDITIKPYSNVIVCNGKNISMPVNSEIKYNHLYIPISTWFEILEIPQQNIMWNKNSVVYCF
ncbi:stalk domain-containing protein [Lachnospiraceae bacterium 46-61]